MTATISTIHCATIMMAILGADLNLVSRWLNVAACLAWTGQHIRQPCERRIEHLTESPSRRASVKNA